MALSCTRNLDAAVSVDWYISHTKAYARCGPSPCVYFVPYFNYVLMGALCVFPISASATKPSGVMRLGGKRRPSALIGIGGGVVLGIVMVVLGVLFKDQYGFSLFLGAPFGMGALTTFLFNRNVAFSLAPNHTPPSRRLDIAAVKARPTPLS
jgi:hypothetical protein